MVRRLRWLMIVAVVAVAVAALAACRGAGDPQAEGGGGEPAASGSLLEFTATTVDGEPFDGRSLAGKPVALWFWAPWCPTCLGQAPGVREAAARHEGKVAVVGVAGLAEAEAMPEFVRMADVGSIPHLSDEAGDVWKRFEVTAQSTFVLLDAEGSVRFKGRLSADEVPDRVAALLG